jgi:hypothetical protein
MTSAEIIEALRRHHGLMRTWPMGTEPWAVIKEFKVGTGLRVESRIDALAVKMGYPHERIAYEVKVSRSDLLKELRNPAKRHHAETVANRWVLATPPGLMKISELPLGAGLVEIHNRGVRWVVHGIKHDCDAPPYFVASLARRASRAESKLDNA